MPATKIELTNTSEPTQTVTLTPTITPLPTNTATPTSLPITFIYQDNVPAKGRSIQEQSAHKSYLYYSQYADLGTVTIYTFSDINLFVDLIFPAIQHDVPTYTKSKFINDWISGGGGNTQAKDIVVISSDFPAWKDNSNRCYKAKNVAHELFHLLQSKLIQHALFRPTLDYGPEWLKEGSAEVFGNKIADGINGCSYAAQLVWWRNKSSEANYPLREVDGGNFSNKTQFWSLAPYAVDYLIKLTPQGEQSIIDFYSAIGKGTSWREAFKDVFGISVEEFYIRFDSARADIVVPTDVVLPSVTPEPPLDTSVCLPQSDTSVECLGRRQNTNKSNEFDYIFSIPFAIQEEPRKWGVNSTCRLRGYGTYGSDGEYNLIIHISKSTHGTCQVKFVFSTSQQLTVDFLVP